MARTHAMCIVCGVSHSVRDMIRSNPLDRGGKPGYMCERCAERIDSYFAVTGEKGAQKSELWTVSEELETSAHTAEGHGNLLHNRFRPTSDSSLGAFGVEYKSPIYQGFGGLVKYQKSIQKMVESGALEMDGKCGHHIHIGRAAIINHFGGGEMYDINAAALDIAWKYRRELLLPLGDYLRDHPAECKLIFGRALGTWAQHPEDAWNNDRRCHDNRYSYINLCTEGLNEYRTKSPEYARTIEFRVNRFQSAEQFGRVIMLEKRMTQALIVNFWDYWKIGVNPEELRYQAAKTGNKLLQLFLKEVEAHR